MQVFTDLSQYSSIIGIAGAVLLVIGFLLRGGNQRKKTGVSVVAMFLMTVGIVMLFYVIVQWVLANFSSWSRFSDRMI